MSIGDDDDAPLDDAQLSELVQHLQAEEAASQASALESVESLQVWMASQPALRQMAIVDSFAEVGPAILRFLRVMLGLDRGPRDDEGRGREGG
jgi:hypothetical protein